MRLSVVVPVLNSHEIFRRQLLHWAKIGVPEDTEIIYMDDGSDPPISNFGIRIPRLQIVPTNDFRPWTWAPARNAGAKVATGEYLLMTDLDYIIPRAAIDAARAFDGDRLGFHREFGVLDDEGNFTQDHAVLVAYGLSAKRLAVKGTKMPPHPNNFVIKSSVYQAMGGFREDLVDRPYPQGEDRYFKRTLMEFAAAGKITLDDRPRPTLFHFPNGQYCNGDVDANPFGLFHTLTRKTERNPWHNNPRYKDT